MPRGIRFLTFFALFLMVPSPGSGQTISQVFQQVRDAVVVIHTTETQYPFLTTKAPVSVAGTGSGVLISPTQILTAAHVVQAANKVLVEFPSGREISATVVAARASHDVALLLLAEPAPASPARIGNSDAVLVGDQVLVVGAPLGESHSLTVGHLSARRSTRGLFSGSSTVEFLQTDAAINPGNSGGPMFNMDGEVVGVVSHILTVSGGSMGLGFAVAANDAMAVLAEGQSVWIGMDGDPVMGPLAALLNVPPPGGGILVTSVAIGSIAESLGLRPSTIPAVIAKQEMLIGGDIVVSVQGISVGGQMEGLEPIVAAMAGLEPGDTLSVTVLREGQLVELQARKRQ
jgi:serine protease Do